MGLTNLWKANSEFFMNGYLMFLKSLSEYQQRAEIARLAFEARWAQDPSLENIF
jgi:hypothetical protein